MEIECDLVSIRDEDLLRKMCQQSEDFGRKKEIRSHLYKLRESRLREFYSTGGLGGDIMNPATDLRFGKTPLTPSHGDSLVDQSFQSLKSKEIRDSESPTREIRFRNSGGVAGGVLVPDTTGWDVQTSSEVSPDGRAFRTETLAKTDGVEKIAGGRAEFAGRNEQKSSASHQGDDKNFVKKAAESSKTHLQEKIVVGDENSGRTEMKSSSVTSSSSKVVSSSSSQVISGGGEPGFNTEPRGLTQGDQYEKLISAANNSSALRSEQQQYQRNERNERNETTSSNVRDTYQENKKYVDMDKASPEYQQHVQYLMSQPGAIVSNTVEYPKPGVKMITTVKQLPDGTTVKTKRYETEASVDTGSISQTMKQQQQQRVSSSTTQKTTEKRVQDGSEDVFTRLAKPRDSNGPASPRRTPDTPSQDDIYSRLQKSRGEQKFSDTIDQRSTQILRETNQQPSSPSPRVVPNRRTSDLVDNVELISTNKTVKKDLNQSVRNEKITSSDFIQTERDRYVLDRDSPSRRAPDGSPEALAPITPGRYGRPQPEDTPTNGYPSTGVVQQSTKSSAKFSESRRYSTETVESYQHSESHNESQDTTTHGFPSTRRPIDEPKGRSPSSGRPGQDFSTHGFPSVRSDKPTQEYPSEKPSTLEKYSTTERVHIVSSDRPKQGDAYPQSPDSTTTTRANYSTNETRRHVTSTTDDFSTHGFPSVRAGTPTNDSPKRPLGSEPAPGDSPRRPSGQEPPANHVRKPSSDGFSTHGFPSVKTGSPTGDSPTRPSPTEPTTAGRKPTTDDLSTRSYPSSKPGRTTPTQSAPKYDDSTRTPNRRPVSVDRDDTISVSSDRSNSITYEKRIDAAHQAFARSLRCASPVESIRRDSISDRPTPRTSVTSVRNSYSPSKRDGRSPSHESITHSETSRISSGTVTKSPRHTTTEIRRVSAPRSPIGRTAPNHVSNETIDITLTRKITPKPTDKPAGRPSTAKEQSNSVEPIMRKKIFDATENFLATEVIAQEPILKKEKYYQLGPSDATLPSSRLKTRQLLGTTPTTSRRPTTYNPEEEVNTLLDTATKHTTPFKPTTITPTRSAKTQDTKPTYKPETIFSSKPKNRPEGYVSQTRATEINEKHNQTTKKQVSYPHYIPSAPKADRSSPYPERPQTSPSDRPTKNVPSPARTTTSTTTHNAQRSTTDRPKVAPSTSPTTTKPSSSPSKVDNNISFTKTVRVDNAITRDTTKTRREPEDIDEGYGPDTRGQRRPKSQRPTSDDEGFEPDSPRAGSPTSDFEYRRPTQPETYDEEDSILKKTRKTDKKTVTNEFLDTERSVKHPRRPEDGEPRRPTDRGVNEPRRPGDKTSSPRTTDSPRKSLSPDGKNRKPSNLTNEPKGPTGQRRPEDEPKGPSGPKRPTDRGSKPPLDRSETFDERCRHILGMENETTIERAKRVQEFIDTESVDVDKRRPAGRSPSPQRKQPSDTVSIEDCDDDDAGITRTTTKTTKTTKGDYPRDRSPTAKPSDDYPRDRSPSGKTPRGQTTVTTTTTKTVNDRSPSTRPRDGSPQGKSPKGTRPSDIDETRPGDRSPTEKLRTVDGTTVRRTTTRDTTIVDEIDDRSPSTRPRDGSPSGKIPRGTRPGDKVPVTADETITSRTTTTSRDTTIGNRSPSSQPRDRSPSEKPIRSPRIVTTETTTEFGVDGRPRSQSPSEKPRRQRPEDSDDFDETYIRRSTKTTKGTSTDEKSHRRPKPTEETDTEDYPRGKSPQRPTVTSGKRTVTDITVTSDHIVPSGLRSQSPSEKPKRPLRPSDRSPSPQSKSNDKYPRGGRPTSEETSPRERSPTGQQPRGSSPSEKPRRRQPSEEEIDEIILETTIETTTTDSDAPKDRPRGKSPSEKPRRRQPTDEDIDETVVQRTSKTTRDRTTLEETTDRSPKDRPRGTSPSGKLGPRDYPRDKSPEKPRGPTRTDETVVQRVGKITTDHTTVDTRSPIDRPRGTSPSEKPRRRQPTDEDFDETVVQRTTIDRTTEDDRSPTDGLRGTSPSEKPRRRQPSDEDTDETVVQRTSKTTRDRTTLEETTDRYPKDRLRGTSPSEKPGPRDYPRDKSPEKPRGPTRIDETIVQSVGKITTDRTTVDTRSPTDRPRGTSPSDKPRRRQPTDKDFDDTLVQMTSKTTVDRTTEDNRSPTDRPRGMSLSDKPRRRQPTDQDTDDTVIQRTSKTTINRTTQDDRSPTDRPRGTSPSDKPSRRQPTDEDIDKTVVQRTSKMTRDRTTLEETTDRSPKDRPRGISPSEKPGPRDYPRDKSPEKPRGPTWTDEMVVQRVGKITTDRTTVDTRSPTDRPRGTSPSEKPRRRQPTDEDFDETVVQRTIIDRTTEDDRSPKDRSRGTSPSDKPRRRQPTDEDIEETTVQRTSKTTRDRTTLEETTDRSPKDRPRGTSPSEKPGPRDYPRNKSPEKPRGPTWTDETVVQRVGKITTDRTTVDTRSPTDRPRGTSPSEKPRRRQPTDEDFDETVVQRTIIDRTTEDDRSPTGRPRGTSPSDKPRRRQPTDEDTNETAVQRTSKTTIDRTTLDDRSPKDRPHGTSPSEKPGPRDYPRDKSPEKPRGPTRTDETVVQRVGKITTDRTTVDTRSPTDRPRGTSPSEKPRRRQPTDKDFDETVVQRTSKTIIDRTTEDDRSPKDRPRGTSPSDKPRRRQPTDEDIEETIIQRTSKTTIDRTTEDNRSPKDRPRGTSPSDKPRRRQPTDEDFDETVVQRTSKTIIDRTTEDDRSPKDRPRGTSPSDKPRRRQPTDEDIDETVIQRTSKTTIDRTTEDNRSPKDRPRGTSPSDKPRRRQPTDEDIDETVVQRRSKTTRDRTTLEETTDRSPKDRPRGTSPSEKPGPRDYPRDKSPEKPRGPTRTDETVIQRVGKITTDRTTVDTRSRTDRPRGTSPSEKPRRRQPTDEDTDETVIQRTSKTTINRITQDDRSPTDRPRGTSTSEKPRRHQPSDEEIDEILVQRTTKTTREEDRPRKSSPTGKPSSRPYPRDSSPSDQPRRTRPSEIDETTVRSTTTRTTLQETDFEKRYPKGRPTGQSPVEKPSTRRPSKPTTVSTTTVTTRNRSTLEEQDLTSSPRPKTQPSIRDKVPTKTTQLSPRSQPTTERRIPAELPSPGRKPSKPTFGNTTKTTTQTTVTRVPSTRIKPTKEITKRPTPTESRPGARQPERKLSPSISPDSSPSRPNSEDDLESPYRSPNMSPSRKSPSPTRSVKLEDITSSVTTTKKTTVSTDKSKPKVTHVTTARLQLSPPTSPTKVTNSPSRKPTAKGLTPKSTGSSLITDKTTTKRVTTTRKDVLIPTDSERDSEVPTDFEDVDSPLSQKTPTRKLPVTERKESAPVHRVTQVDKDVQKMSRSTSENIIKTPFNKRPVKHEPLEPITQREATRPTGGKTSPKTERRPSKHLSTKTINLTTFDKVINSQDMENVVIDIQQAKSSREPSPNKIVPTPVAVDLYTGKPRYPDVVQEPEDEPRRKPNVKNIPIFEEETNDFVGCQITEVNENSLENTTKVRTRKFIEGEQIPQRLRPTILTGDNVDNECLLSVHDKVSKFISTAEEVSKPKTSAPFRRDLPEEDAPLDDECLLTVDEKVNKFLKTAEGVTRDVITSTPKPIQRPRIDDLDEDLRTDECVLSVSEKVNKFTTKAEKLAPSAPQRSPELVARIERQISRQSDAEPESPLDAERYPESLEDDDSPTTVRKVKQTKSLFERDEKKYTERQIDILSRPSVWDKKPKPDVKLDDIIGYSPKDEPRRKSPVKDQPNASLSKPTKPDTVSRRKEIFENKTTGKKITTTSKPSSKSPERVPKRPTGSPTRKQPSDESDSRYPNEFTPRYVDGYPQEPDDVHEDVYGSSKTRRLHETSSHKTTTVRQSPTRSPTTPTTTRKPRQPADHSPSPTYFDDPRNPTRGQPQTDRYMETREESEYTTRRRSSTQKYPEDHSPDRRTPHGKPLSPNRKQPVEEPEDYTFSSTRAETNKQHHTTRTSYRSPKDTLLTQTSIPDDEDYDHSPARSTSTISSQKRSSTHRTTSNRLTEDTTSRRPRRPSGNEPSTPLSSGRGPRPRGVPETVAARRNIFEQSPGDVSPRPGHRRPSYMEPTKSSLEHIRKDSLEITKTNYSRKSSMEDEPYEPSPRSAVKFGVGLRHKDEPKPRRKLSSSDIPNIEDIFELDLLEEMLNIVTLYEQRRRVRAQIRVVKKLLETKTKEEVSRMTKITTFRRTSSSSVRDSPIPRRDTPMRPDRYRPSDDIDSESIIESRHVDEREEVFRERSISPQTKTSEVRKIGDPSSPKRTVPRKEEPKESKPIWATKNILKKPSENEKAVRALSAKKTTSTTSSSTSRTQQTHRQRVPADEDCITSSYGIGPTDEDGRPLFGIRALKKKTTTSKTAQPSETTKVTGTVITEKYYSENGAEPIGERKVTVYSSNPEVLLAMETQYDRRDSETVKRERLSKDGLTSVTKVQKIGKYKPGDIPAITDDSEFGQNTSKTVRRGSVKEMSEKFIRKESSSSVTEKSSGYPKAGLILRTRTNSGATADTADQYEVRARSTEYDDESDNDCDVQIRTSRKHSRLVTESDDETEIRRKVNTRSFLNSAGSKVTGVDDVLDRMRNADNVVVDGDTLEDREARALLNKFLGASVLMTGMESNISQKEPKRKTTGSDNSTKQGVKTTRVTKTIKTAAAGGNSSSPVARETCDFEEIWDEVTLKELLEKSTSYEERRAIRARLRQLMADREAGAELVASAKAELDNGKKVKTTSGDKKVVEQQKQLDDESSCSEYEEIIEEYTATESEEEEEEEAVKTVVPDKKKDEVKEEPKTKKIIEEVKKTTITKKEEPKQTATKTVVVEKTTVIKKDAIPSHSVEQKKSDKKEDTNDEASVSDNNKESTTTTEKTETKEEDGGVVTTTTKVTTRTVTGAGTPKPVSPFAKFQQLDKQNSLQSPKSPLTPTTPGGSSSTPIFRFTDPALNARAATVKDQLLQWCQSKTQEYENVQITNFSGSWTDGLAFCALIHHFLPDAFDYSKLNPKQRRHNFELAFRVADEKAGIAPLLDVEDMVVMKRPDWKCVFTYVQSIYRRFRNCQ